MGGLDRRTEPQRATGSLGGGGADGRDSVPRLPHARDLSWGCCDESRHPGRPGGVDLRSRFVSLLRRWLYTMCSPPDAAELLAPRRVREPVSPLPGSLAGAGDRSGDAAPSRMVHLVLG